jgi:hypothetical protein
MIVERGEECHAKAAIRHSVQQTMAGGGQKEIRPQSKSAHSGKATAKSYNHHGTCQEGAEQK